MLVVKYFWIYLVLGLVLNTSWAILGTVYLCSKVKFDEDNIEKVMDVFLDVKGGYSMIYDMLENKRLELLLMAIYSYLAWPYNIAYGVRRLQIALDYIDKELT